MRIMTSNIWGDYFGNPVSVREGDLLSVYEKYSPDVLGLQEATKGWYDGKMFPAISEKYLFVGTELYENTNFVPLLVKKGKFDLRAKGYEMLNDTPDRSKAITWAYLIDKESGKSFAVCNTHFWWKSGEEHELLRKQNAEQLLSLMRSLEARYACPVFAFGDMNCNLKSPAFDFYRENGVKLLELCSKETTTACSYHFDPVLGEDGKYHGKMPSEKHDLNVSIDHIIGIGDFSAERFAIVTDREALDATDHCPVFVDVEI